MTHINRDEVKEERIVGYLNAEQSERFMAFVKKYGAGRSAAIAQIIDTAFEQEFGHIEQYKRVNQK